MAGRKTGMGNEGKQEGSDVPCVSLVWLNVGERITQALCSALDLPATALHLAPMTLIGGCAGG